MNDLKQLVNRLGYWSAIIIVLLVVLIDVGMILSAILYPMTAISSIEAYASSFNSMQMFPLIPSLLLAPVFVLMMRWIHYNSPQEKKVPKF